VTLELTDEELALVRSSGLRVAEDGRSLAAVTFDDRWGAVAKTLRDNLADPEAAERGDEEMDLEARRFAELSALAKQMLPKVEVHTGAGLYEVGPGKTYSTIQSALDQLWTDQGSAAFTATQIIRVFASTYDENVTPNASLNPDEQGGFQLVIEGDPADDRDNIIIQPTSGNDSLYVNCDSAVIRHLTFTSAVAIYGPRSYTGNTWLEVTDCVVALTTAANSAGINPRGRAYIADCDVSIQSQGSAAMGIYSYAATILVRRCKVTGNGGSASGITGRMGHVVESCIVSGFMTGFGDYQTSPGIGPHQIRNCVVYNCSYGLSHVNSWHATLDVVNTIFHSCTNVFVVRTAMPEWSGADVIGDVARLLNCCFYNYTTFAEQDGGAGDKTYAEFIALNRVEAAGNLDATDPRLTAPGSGDFSLAADSPCRNAGHGSGVTTGRNGAALDAAHPDIGAWSSGTVAAPARPSASLAAVSGSSITVDLQGDADAEHTAELVRAQTGAVVDSAVRSGPGQVSLTAPEAGARYFVVAVGASVAGRSLPSAPCEVLVSAGDGPFEEVRMGIVARLRAHSELAALLGTDACGAVPIYAANPAKPRACPCIVYRVEGVPDNGLSTRGRWDVTATFEARSQSPAVNDSVVGCVAEVLDRKPFEGTSWAVKGAQCTSDEALWEDDGRTEIRRLAWALVVDRTGS
jgi:hypothetical protein